MASVNSRRAAGSGAGYVEGSGTGVGRADGFGFENGTGIGYRYEEGPESLDGNGAGAGNWLGGAGAEDESGFGSGLRPESGNWCGDGFGSGLGPGSGELG